MCFLWVNWPQLGDRELWLTQQHSLALWSGEKGRKEPHSFNLSPHWAASMLWASSQPLFNCFTNQWRQQTLQLAAATIGVQCNIGDSAQSASQVPAWPLTTCSDKAPRTQSSGLKREQEWARRWRRRGYAGDPQGKCEALACDRVSAAQEGQAWMWNEEDWKDELGLEQLHT